MMSQQNSAPDTPRLLYQKLIQDHKLQLDTDQVAALPTMDALVDALNAPAKREMWNGVEVWRQEDGQPAAKGLFLFGPVGRGKSMLMQLIFDAVALTQKRRVHFHPFMEELHRRIHKAKPEAGVDVMLHTASLISAESRLLCFDEFFVDHIADGMLLGRLLEALFKCGVTLCATSNWAPEDLFKGGHNRTSFLPLLKELRQNIQVFDLARGSDWRRNRAAEAVALVESPMQTFAHLTKREAKPTKVPLRRDNVNAKGAWQGVYWFGFHDLCVRSIGTAEYIDLCTKAKAVIISDVPKLDAHNANAAARFVTLIDLLYEHQVPLRLFCDVELDDICTEGEVAFEFKRAVSRVFELMNMAC